MKIKLNNVGPFRKGEIKLEDLTLISGVNDTGKSFLNKIIYSSIKLLNTNKILLTLKPLKKIVFNWNNESEFIFYTSKYYHAYHVDQDYNYSQYNSTNNNRVNQKNLNYYNMNRILEYNQEINLNFEYINRMFKDIEVTWVENEDNYISLIEKFENLNKKIKETLNLLINDEKNNRKKIDYKFYQSERLIVFFKKISREITQRLEFIKKNDLGFINKAILDVNFNSESIKNRYFWNELSSILFKDQNIFFKIKIENENFVNIINNVSIMELIKDVTYINNLSNLNGNINQKNSGNYINSFSNFNYLFDVLEKIEKSNNPLFSDKLISSKFSKLIKQINENFDINSQINYSKKTISKNGMEFKIANVSQGLINLEIFKLLILSGIFEENKVVIFDEPENYFHPKWQNLYVETIFELIKLTKCKIILSTHSPYIIESVDTYIENNPKFKDLKVNFAFLTEKEKGISLIENFTDPSKILELLVEPYDELDQLKYEWSNNDF